jgi:hypothetical protein
MALLNFDARTVAPQTGFDPVPPGWYNVMVDESEMKPTKDGSGSYLKVRYNILDGQFANRKIYTMINLQNKNPQATEIGLKQLSALAHAVGVLLVQDSQQLHGIPLKVKAKVRPAEGDYEAQNNITQWENINAAVGDVAAPAAGAPAFAQPGAPAAGFPAMGGAPAAAQPWAQPGAGAPVAAPAQQPMQFQQPAQQAPAGMPSWAAAPAAQQAPAAAAPGGATPWNQQPAANAQPNPAAGAPTGFNPQGAVPPWAQK